MVQTASIQGADSLGENLVVENIAIFKGFLDYGSFFVHLNEGWTNLHSHITGLSVGVTVLHVDNRHEETS